MGERREWSEEGAREVKGGKREFGREWVACSYNLQEAGKVFFLWELASSAS